MDRGAIGSPGADAALAPRSYVGQARSKGLSPFPGLARLAVRLLDIVPLPVEFLADCHFELPPLAFCLWERLAAHRAIPGARLHVYQPRRDRAR